MNQLSRRALAQYAAQALKDGQPAEKLAKQLAGVLAESGRADEVDYLLGDIAWELEQSKVLASASVASARPLTQDLEESLKSQIKQATGAGDVRLEPKVDASLLGGLKVETATRVWDTSIRRKLTQLRESI